MGWRKKAAEMRSRDTRFASMPDKALKVLAKAEWDESQHPRDDHGKFSGSGGGSLPATWSDTKPDPSHADYQRGANDARMRLAAGLQDPRALDEAVQQGISRYEMYRKDYPHSALPMAQYDHGYVSVMRSAANDPALQAVYDAKQAEIARVQDALAASARAARTQRDINSDERDHANQILRDAGQRELSGAARIKTSLGSDGSGRVRVFDGDGTKRITLSGEAAGHGEGSWLTVHGASGAESSRAQQADMDRTGGDAPLWATTFRTAMS